jgi:class 3 adenylate cyclase
MGATSTAPSARFREERAVLVLADLAGFTRVFTRLSALETAELVHRFYVLCGEHVARHGGRVVKFAGDNCLAMFADGAGADAVAYAMELREAVVALAAASGVEFDLGSNIHRASVVTGRFGAGASEFDDVIGSGVVHTYRMGAGAGLRISEPVYRQLPNEQRHAWHKRQPPATYTFEP